MGLLIPFSYLLAYLSTYRVAKRVTCSKFALRPFPQKNLSSQRCVAPAGVAVPPTSYQPLHTFFFLPQSFSSFYLWLNLPQSPPNDLSKHLPIRPVEKQDAYAKRRLQL